MSGQTDPPLLHSGSHRELISPGTPPEAIGQKVDAIIVPTSRSAPYLRHVIALAAELRCTLVVLCSKYATAQATVREVLSSEHPTVDLVALDVPDIVPEPMPQFQTSDLLRRTVFQRRNDTFVKRNIGLLLSRLVGWRGVVFLDDDILIEDRADLRRAVGMLGEYDAVGLHIGGFPDNSVVCHAHRRTGGEQDTFVGGGALAVPTDRVSSFFPNIYNEDWFFLLDDVRLRPVAQAGEALQQPYDPFHHPERARTEELGDTLAEGIYYLLDTGKRVRDADKAHWHRYIAQRGAFIEQVLDRVRSAPFDADERARMVTSLKAAAGRLALITPELCVEYLHRWRRDRARWERTLADLRPVSELEVALKTLRLDALRVHNGHPLQAMTTRPAAVARRPSLRVPPLRRPAAVAR